MAGRPRKPTNVLLLSGAKKNHPERLKEREGEPVNKNPIGSPVKFLTKHEKAAWREIVKLSIDGVLGEADRLAVEHASRLLVKCRGLETYEDDGKEIKIWASVQEQTLFLRYLSQLGMTPADRSKINIPGKKEKNPFDDD